MIKLKSILSNNEIQNTKQMYGILQYTVQMCGMSSPKLKENEGEIRTCL